MDISLNKDVTCQVAAWRCREKTTFWALTSQCGHTAASVVPVYEQRQLTHLSENTHSKGKTILLTGVCTMTYLYTLLSSEQLNF